MGTAIQLFGFDASASEEPYAQNVCLWCALAPLAFLMGSFFEIYIYIIHECLFERWSDMWMFTWFVSAAAAVFVRETEKIYSKNKINAFIE